MAEPATSTKAPVAYIDMVFSAPKSASVAWALAPTEAERSVILEIHREAVGKTMSYVEEVLGHTTKGKGGRDGTEPGSMVSFFWQHFQSRPTIEIEQTDTRGEKYTNVTSLPVTGDPQIHTHVNVLNLVHTASGRVGAVDLDLLGGRVHEFGAVFQGYFAAGAINRGIEIGLDRKRQGARLLAVPQSVCDLYSKRSLGAEKAAREFAVKTGENWDKMGPEHKVALMRRAVETERLAKIKLPQDDAVSEWQKQAAAAGYRHRSVLRPDSPDPDLSPRVRHEAAYKIAMPMVEKAFTTSAKLDEMELRVIAARSLIPVGLQSPADLDAVMTMFKDRGVTLHGERTALVWAKDLVTRGQEHTSVTTGLHVRQERELIALAKSAHETPAMPVPIALVEQAIERRGLSFDGAHGRAQRTAIDQFTNGRQLEVLIAVGGAGKTKAVLPPAVDGWKAQGRDVWGVSTGWRQVGEMAEASIDPDRLKSTKSFG